MKRGWVLVWALVSGCGADGDMMNRIDGGGSGSVTATARIVNGASPVGTALFAPPPPPAPPEDGQWLASPKRLEMKLITLGLSPGGGSIAVDCPVVYDSTQPGGVQLGECLFTLAPGTYDTLDVGLSTDVKVIIDDAAAGLFTTAIGVQITEPVGGAQELTYKIGGMTGETRLSPIKLPQPLTVADGDSVLISVVIDALHSMRVTVTGTTVTLGHTGSPYPNDPGRPDIVATAGQLAKIKTYASAGLGTAGSYCASMCTAPPTQGITAVSVFYTSTSSVGMVNLRLNGTPQSCAMNLYPAFVNIAESYLGLDTNKVAGWAVFGQPSLMTYSAVFAMPQVTDITDTTELYCQNTTTDPAPSGGSFASGAPAIQTAGNSLGSYTLVAQ